MKIEHIGICVPAPISMGKWYRDHLGFKIIRCAGNDVDGVSFIVDKAGQTILELGRLPEGPPLDARCLLPLQLRGCGGVRLRRTPPHPLKKHTT